ncbi:MAG: DUF3221 domain-containing protein [Paenisporosarcina sp.]|nr:DUF3221 domain-containing protein [Paenisporosarcina sp.]
MRGKRAVFLVLGLVLLTIVIAFGSMQIFFNTTLKKHESTNSMEGLVVEMDNQSVLLIEDLSKEQAKGKTTDQLLEKGLNAIWFTFSLEQIKGIEKYDQLKVYFDHVEESYPGQANAKEVETLAK